AGAVSYRGFSGGQSPAAIAAAWRALGLEVADVEKLPPETLAGLTKTPGLPARAQDAACRALLKLALKSPERVHRLMGFRPGELSLADFTTEVSRLRDAWEDAKLASADIPGKPTVHLTGFGRHDGAVTAAISLGDPDTAERVAVNVSGMNSDMTSIGNGVHAAESLLRAALQENGEQSYAIVTWIGYRSPSATEVRFQDRADSGARELSRYIDGTFAARAASGNPMKGLAVYAHSYGSTTASLALMQIQHKIDTFVAYGSACSPKEVTVAKMNGASVFSTAARGDNVAWAGFTGTDRQQPQHMRGVTEFSSEVHGDSKATTAHDMFTDGYSGSFWNWGGKVGYLTTGTRSVTTMGKLFATGAL
ncbi:MAG: hypothetical protein J0H64_06305, partial [Actinobacteria bacterium]|nr:hypothetical protein [Actinomycetota bacterium]